jgi:hypothetical protein
LEARTSRPFTLMIIILSWGLSKKMDFDFLPSFSLIGRVLLSDWSISIHRAVCAGSKYLVDSFIRHSSVVHFYKVRTPKYWDFFNVLRKS